MSFVLCNMDSRSGHVAQHEIHVAGIRANDIAGIRFVTFYNLFVVDFFRALASVERLTC